MSVSGIEPPLKKRRFFASSPEPQTTSTRDDGNVAAQTSSATERRASSPTASDACNAATQVSTEPVSSAFDVELFESIVGKVSASHLKILRDVSSDNTERAINMYLDGSWHTTAPTTLQAPSSEYQAHSPKPPESHQARASKPTAHAEIPKTRYVGAFGVGGWATRSGAGTLKHGDRVQIERATPKQSKVGRNGKPLPMNRQRTDIIVRFTNAHGEEIGRLPEETAKWVSSLIDQKVCHFDGSCFYAPDRVRIHDTIHLQLSVYFHRAAFEEGGRLKLSDQNRATGVFEEKETREEQDLRLRQAALLKLFGEVNLEPTASNALTEKHKREGLLQIAEVAEHYDEAEGGKDTPPAAASTSSPPTEEEPPEEGKELEQDQLDSLYRKAQSFDFEMPSQEPSDTFILDLRTYQKQALHWMSSKEKDTELQTIERSMHPLWEEYRWPVHDLHGSPLETVAGCGSFYVNPYSGELSLDFPSQEQHCLGGILADEMGLGKTIECLSLIHSNMSDVAIRASNLTKSSVNDLPRLAARASVESAPCTTLVVAPMSLLAQWETEATKASRPGSLRTLVYYGADKAVDLQNLCCEKNAAAAPHLVITSYGIVLSEYTQIARRGGDKASSGGLYSLNFHRCILDEAHYIKNRQSKTAKACYELEARHRWVLTGTPIVNRLEDLFSLVHFLRVEPWSNFSYWKTFITVPFESGNFIRALNVVQTVLEPLVIRRTKDMKAPDASPLVPLPPRNIKVEEIRLSKAEQEVYDWIYVRAKRTLNANVEAGTLLKSYTTIFAQLLRLRQSCCHPILTRNKALMSEEGETGAASDAANGLADDLDLQDLILRFESGEDEQDANKFGAHVLTQIREEVDSECPICAEEPLIEPVVTGCWHSACKKCLLDYIEHEEAKGKLPLCFNCREPINERDVFEVVRHDDGSGLSTEEKRITLRRVSAAGSAKISALISHLRRVRAEEVSAKVVVFSQFTSFLDLIGPALAREGIPCMRFDGAMSQAARKTVLEQFAGPSPKGVVLLLSLRAGGVGLNLTAARHVFMMDPWWSFAVEAQAIDRVHRMGQDREVHVVRFVVDGSIEQRMLKIQDRKTFIASSLGMMSEEEKKLQRIEDIKELLA